MEQSTSETCTLEQIIVALEYEKACLEEKLETELEDVKDKRLRHA